MTTETKEVQWYIVLRHSNFRSVRSALDGCEAFDDYDAASGRAAQLSRFKDDWYVPMRVSEYHEKYGTYSPPAPTTVNVDGWLTINTNKKSEE